MSIALLHQQRLVKKQQKEAAAKRIEAAAAETIEATASDYQAFQQLLDALELDIQRMSGLSVDDKIRIKREELLPKYQEYVDQYLTGDELYQNPVLVNLVIWLFDVDDIEQGLYYGLIAVEQKQPAPERFVKRRDFATILADMMMEWCARQQSKAHSIQPYFDIAFKKAITDSWPMPDALKAKFYVQAGDNCFEQQETEQSLAHYLRAVELDQKRTKRKTNIQKLLKKIELANQDNAIGDKENNEQKQT